jgi:hypothetical protein
MLLYHAESKQANPYQHPSNRLSFAQKYHRSLLGYKYYHVKEGQTGL